MSCRTSLTGSADTSPPNHRRARKQPVSQGSVPIRLPAIYLRVALLVTDLDGCVG